MVLRQNSWKYLEVKVEAKAENVSSLTSSLTLALVSLSFHEKSQRTIIIYKFLLKEEGSKNAIVFQSFRIWVWSL